MNHPVINRTRKSKAIYWSSKELLKVRYQYGGELYVYYLNNIIKIFDYIDDDDFNIVHQWLDEFEKNIKLF